MHPRIRVLQTPALLLGYVAGKIFYYLILIVRVLSPYGGSPAEGQTPALSAESADYVAAQIAPILIFNGFRAIKIF